MDFEKFNEFAMKSLKINGDYLKRVEEITNRYEQDMEEAGKIARTEYNKLENSINEYVSSIEDFSKQEQAKFSAYGLLDSIKLLRQFVKGATKEFVNRVRKG